MQIKLKYNIALFICCTLALTACETDKPLAFEEEELLEVQERLDTIIIEEEERPFALYYHQLVMAFASGDAASFNGLIHPDLGCYLIEAPGAIPAISKITDVENVLRKGSERSFLDFDNVFLSFPLTEDSLPTVDCDSPDGFYSKEGTFVQDINTLTKETIWKYVGLDDESQRQIAELAETVNKTIVNTAGFIAYFSKIDDVWYITFIDIRVPCTA